MDYIYLAHTFVTLFSILNPLGAIPVFLTITANESSYRKKSTIKRTVTAVIIILLLSAFVGNYLLEFFGIDIDSFRVAGGILLLIMAIHMLQAKTLNIKTNDEEQDDAIEKEDVAVVPLAIPLLAGPGGISTVILFASAQTGVISMLSLMIVIIAVSLTILPILLLAEKIGEKIGTTGLNVATRVMGLILASISVKFILEGTLHFVKSFA